MGYNEAAPWGSVVYHKLVSLWEKEETCDVTIVCDDGCIKAPSSLLCALSEKLSEIILFSTDKVLQFKNVFIKTWKDLLDIIYTGKVAANQKDKTSLKSLYTVLSFAYYLGIDNILRLFKHITSIDDVRMQSEIWDSLYSELCLDILVEYSHIENGNATSYQTTFSTEDLSGLVTYLQRSEDTVNVKDILKRVDKSKDKKIIEKCLNCDDACKAVNVQCVYCDEIIEREQRTQHMTIKHKLTPSTTWPYTCTLKTVDHMPKWIGQIWLKDETGKRDWLAWFKCHICHSYHETLGSFLEHFLYHNIFPCMCQHCGFTFSQEDFRNEHVRYCGKANDAPDENSSALSISAQSNVQLLLDSQNDDVQKGGQSPQNNSLLKDTIFSIDNKSTEMSDSLNLPRLDEHVTIKKEKINIQCIDCEGSCLAPSVQCLYCYKVVPSDISHMEKDHFHSTQANSWVVACKINTEKKCLMVLRRELDGDSENCECVLCGYKAAKREDVIEHLSEIHNVCAVFCCKYCSSGFKTAMARNGHQHLCAGGSCLKCNYCKQQFTSFDQLQLHNKIKHKEKVHNTRLLKKQLAKNVSIKTEISDDSDTDYSKDEFSDGDTSDNSNDETTLPIKYEPDGTDVQKKVCFNCKDQECTAELVKCAYCFKVVKNDLLHMAEVHPLTPKSSVWPITCRFISRTITNPTDWAVTLKFPDGENGFHHKCLKCKAAVKFSTKDSLIRHMRNRHRISPKFCHTCEMGFIDFPHKRDHHHFCSGGKVVQCEICKEYVGNFKLLKDHKRIHHNSKKEANSNTDSSDNDEVDKNEDSCYGHEDKKNSTGPSENLKESNKLYVEVIQQIENIESQNDSYELDPSVSEVINSNFSGIIKATEGTYIDDIYQGIVGENTGSSDQTSICVSCNGECKAPKVKCMLCYKIVDNKLSHMDDKHPFTPKNIMWPFNCRYLSKSERLGLKDWVISVKESVQIFSDEGISEKIQYRCVKCKKFVFTDMKSLKKHMKFKHKCSVVTCKVCETGFSRGRYLRDHQHFCMGGRPMSCTLCERVIGSIKALDDHVRAVHMKAKATPPESEVSDIEDKTQISSDESDNDENGSVSPLKMKWKKREKNFRKKVAAVLLSSKSKHQEDSERHSYCSNCSSKECQAEKVKCLYCFKVVDNDVSHMDTHHPYTPKSNPWLFNCRFLIKTALNPRGWMVTRKEPTQKQSEDGTLYDTSVYRCIRCNTVFTTRKALLKHMDYKHKAVPLLCVVCESGFTCRKYLGYHEHYCNGGKLFKCHVCNKEIGTRKDFILHMRKSHSQLQGLKRKKTSSSIAAVTSVIKKPKLSIPLEEKPDHVAQEAGMEMDQNKDILSLDDMLFNMFEKVPSERKQPYTKMCMICGEHCEAESVKCTYCNDIVIAENMNTHMSTMHSFTPPHTIWPVSCRFVKYLKTTPNVLGKPIREKVDSIETSGSDNPLYTSKYECGVCKEKCVSSAAVEKHLQDSHSLKVTFCTQCGYGLKKGTALEHVYFCSGGELLKCNVCDKIVGGRQNAIVHRSRIHPINRKKSKAPKDKYKSFRPKTVKKNAVHVMERGKYGYNILSAECTCEGGICKREEVKCGLCNEIVPKDDIHMKLKHPYSPCTTWIVYCKYSVVQCGKLSKDLVGQRVPLASEEEILSSPYIPCVLPYKYQCVCCKAECKDNAALRDHVKSHHVQPGRRYFSCKHCESFYTNMSTDTFANHLHLCGEGKLFSCEFCNELCSSHKYLYCHIAANHQTEKLAKQSEMGIVKEEHMEVPEGTEVSCSECEFKTANVQKMRTHCQQEHDFTTARLNQVCKFCYGFFRTRSAREKHEQHAHIGNQRYLCDICGKDFEIPYQLKTHLYYFHKGGREVASKRKKGYAMKEETCICHHCGNLYKNSFACKQHIKNVHEKRDLFNCKYCIKTFSSRATCKLHEDRHIGNKTHSCVYCGFKAYTGYAVNRHIEKAHPGVGHQYLHGSQKLFGSVYNNENEVVVNRDETTFHELVKKDNEVAGIQNNQQLLTMVVNEDDVAMDGCYTVFSYK